MLIDLFGAQMIRMTMEKNRNTAAFIFGIFIFLGLGLLGVLLGNTAVNYKALDRTVTVKGLSEHEAEADIVIWPIQFSETGNDLTALYDNIEESTSSIKTFLLLNGIQEDEISLSPLSITDKSALEYGGDYVTEFRYTSTQTVTVYSKKVPEIRSMMNRLSELGRDGIVFTGNSYQIEYIFTRLNELKPEMIEEATTNARAVAQKFAADSESRLGKIKNASQGQFSIYPRDNNNPHIKTIRVVSTIEYYLSD